MNPHTTRTFNVLCDSTFVLYARPDLTGPMREVKKAYILY